MWFLLGAAAANKSLERIFGEKGFLGSLGVLEMGSANGIHGVNSKPFSSALAAFGSVEVDVEFDGNAYIYKFCS